jgi:DNA polymerase sigma
MEFVAVIQTAAGRFEVFFLYGSNRSSLYPQTSLLGVCVHIDRSTPQNNTYAYTVAHNMNMESYCNN